MTDFRKVACWLNVCAILTACGGGGHVGGKTSSDGGREAAPGADGAGGPSDDERDEAAEVAAPRDGAHESLNPDAALDTVNDATTEEAGDADAVAPCARVSDGHFFVDPIDGRDDPSRTGAAGCAFRSIKAAIASINAAGAPGPTITIINTKGVPTLDKSTGEDAGFTAPAGVTITAEDPTRSPPIITLTSIGVGIELQGSGWRLSHLDIRCDGPTTGVENSGGGGSLDHVTIAGCVNGHGFFSTRGQITLGPGVTIGGNRYGIKVADGALVILGGAGADHTSISGNQVFGVWLHAEGMPTSADVQGRDISPSAPDQNDVAADDNGTAIELETGQLTLTARGLHATGNGTGIKGNATMTVRGSFLANNLLSAVSTSLQLGSAVNLGGPGAQDPGRNVFSVAEQTGAVNTQGAICVSGASSGTDLLAAGNIFGGVDCAVGGALTTAPSCAQQADLAGADLGAIDVGACSAP